jgi:hypothetical protein
MRPGTIVAPIPATIFSGEIPRMYATAAAEIAFPILNAPEF